MNGLTPRALDALNDDNEGMAGAGKEPGKASVSGSITNTDAQTNAINNYSNNDDPNLMTSQTPPTDDVNVSYTDVTPQPAGESMTLTDLDPGMDPRDPKGRSLHNTHITTTELFINFSKAEEGIYQTHYRRQKLQLLPVLVTMATVHASLTLVLGLQEYEGRHDIPRLVAVCCLAAVVVLLQVFVSISLLPGRLNELLAYVAWLATCVQLFLDAATSTSRHMPSDGVGWLALLLYVTQVILPLGVLPSLLVAVILTGVHTAMACLLWEDGVGDLGSEIAANLLIASGALVLGLAGSLFMDRMCRKSVLETKSALRAKANIEGVYKEKETLLLSVLPKHIADAMVKDIGSLSDGPFRKIYMSRYEDVSILFADIVGFTAISSNVTASELVRILNELFGSFDVLANKFHQDRIKILGDCYYCVCGALAPRPDHGVLSIHMGLSMVDAISFVREKTGKDVNMRVGVHTGACLGGVLGQRQWQFDVLGKEVTVANKMESGGLPGRVHISESTRKCLDGEFELEEGHGGSREEELRLKNLQTYLVRSVIKPYPEGTLDMPRNEITNGHVSGTSTSVLAKGTKRSTLAFGITMATDDNGAKTNGHGNARAGVKGEDGEGSCGDLPGDGGRTEETHIVPTLSTVGSSDDSGRKLAQALAEKDKYRIVNSQTHLLTLNFRDKATQKRYQQRLETYSGLPFVAFTLTLLFAFLARLTVLPRTPIAYGSFIVGEVSLVIMAIISMSVTQSKRFPKPLVRFAVAVESNQMSRVLWSFTACVIFFFSDVIPMTECDATSANASATHRLDPSDTSCHLVVYFSHTTSLALIAVSSLVTVGHMTKAVVMYLMVGAQCLLHLVVAESAFDNYEALVYDGHTDRISIKYKQIAQIVATALILASTDRIMEWTGRKLFMLKEETKKEKEMLVELQRKNEALVFNLMPSHVARRFIGTRKRDKELYSHAYDESGVIFAACPNFNAFYNESAVNNNGLECIRFLNEIISDYDELLNQACFQTIVKIKTVGSTYMAASGMTVSSRQQGRSTKEKWSHLHDLLLFACSLQDAISKLNEQSFNTFFLRIGLNHGPVIAGVIGARKPHYDIWGNTVNVASRMESTGQPGKIQVVEETKVILEEFGHHFEKRGLIKVKGKGQLMTYFLDREATHNDVLIPNQVPTC